MPFENLTGDTTLNWFQRGISSLIINGLGNSSELSVSDDQTMFEVIESINQVISAGISPSLAKEVAEKVVAETYISGSYQGKEGKYWILVNLVNTDNGDIIWTNKVTGDLKSSGYLDLADSLCNEIKNYLEIKALEENADYDFREAYPKSSEAYRYFIEGMNMILTTEWASAIQSLKKALEIDSTFTFASFYLAYAYSYSGEDIQSALWTKKTYGSKNRVPPKYRLLLEQWYAQLISKNLMDINRYGKLLEESGINSRLLWFDIGSTYYYCGAQYKKAVEAYEKVMEISLERGGNWKFEPFYWKYGQALHDLGKHEEEKKMYETGLSFFPDSWRIKNNQAVCALSLGDTTKANKYIAKFKSLTLEKGYSENVTEQYLGQVYRDAKIIDKAEVHFRNAYKLDSQNRRCVFWLAWLLIDNDININEGMELSRKALEIWPDAYDLLLVKGWGCYKQGKYKEALDILEKSWDLYPFYSTELAFYIQEAKKAVAGQKNN